MAASCTAPAGELIQFLGRVPYNSSAVWIARYPHLPSILADSPCVPKYNAIVENSFCDLGALPFVDQANATIVSWDSTAWGNGPNCTGSGV